MSLRDVLFIAALADYSNRRHNREEHIRRLQDNVDRWNESLKKMEDAAYRAQQNIIKNQERLSKSSLFLTRLRSPETQDWLSRQQKNSMSTKYEVRETALKKIRDHEAKEQDVEDQIRKIEQWIYESRSKIRDIESKIDSTRSKISDVEYKIRHMN